MDYIKPFLIGGSVIAGSKFVSKVASPALAPIVGGMPTGIIASYFLTTNAEKRDYFSGYFISAILLAIAILFIHIVSMFYKDLHIDIVSTLALLFWCILSYFSIEYFIPKSKKKTT